MEFAVLEVNEAGSHLGRVHPDCGRIQMVLSANVDRDEPF